MLDVYPEQFRVQYAVRHPSRRKKQKLVKRMHYVSFVGDVPV